MQLTPVQKLEDTDLTLSPKPLVSPAELKAFYRNELNQIRGGDKTKNFAKGLAKAHGTKDHYKMLFMSHQGVGKSTEISRLIQLPEIARKFSTIRFCAQDELDPVSLRTCFTVL
ncbi:hypothetical protein [Candidatus Cyanaurora vandensis]|uniref:hypothetical protein n=1 Tax=Candidatus Cyanaurora vandensis TaxID=2714958 RepID=UPI00257A9EDE|nr:hypothetical protein [Candidatus Cyanaurora vandensis]